MRIGRGDPSGSPIYLQSNAPTQTFGVLAKRRGGKSYTAAVMAEEFAAAHVPFTVLDPTGAWWGLRASANGEKPGLPVVILGGAHADAPLEPTGGKIVADLIVDHPGFYVLDLEAFESNAAQDRFVTDFAARLYRRKATNRDVMHLFIDEADSFVPQRPGPSQLTMLGAFEAIVRRGGIRGLGTTLISQRAAVTNKNVLTQLDTLIMLQTTGPQDQDAVFDWVKRNATPAEFAEVKASLASLPRGTAWVYTPESDTLVKVAIRERRTFNSSATPEAGETVLTPRKLATVDLDAVKVAMAASIEKANAEDPARFRAQIADLRRQMANQKPETIEKTVEKMVPYIPPEVADLAKGIERLLDNLTDEVTRLLRMVEDSTSSEPILMQTAEYGRDVTFTRTIQRKANGGNGEIRVDGGILVPRNGEMEPVPDGQLTVTMKAGARRMLEVLARHHPVRLTRAQWATLSKMKVTGGTWGTYLSVLKRAGLIEESDDLVSVTPSGLTVAGVEPGNPMTPDEVRELWRSKLKAGARNMLDVLIDAYPHPLDRHDLAQRVGMEVTGGTFGTYLSTLKRNGLIDVAAGLVGATKAVMGL